MKLLAKIKTFDDLDIFKKIDYNKKTLGEN